MNNNHNNQGPPPTGAPLPENSNGPPPGDTSATRDKMSRSISSATTTESPEVVRQLESMNKNFQEMMRQMQPVKAVNIKCETCGGPQSYTECPAIGGYTQEASYATTGSIPSITIANPRGDVKAITTRSDIAYDGPTIPPTPSLLTKEVKRETEATKDKVQATRFESCMALADLGSSINLMSLFIWNKLSLSDLTPTRMTLELATRSFAYPTGIAEDVFVQVGKFIFPVDFVVVDYDVDPRVPLILGRPFLRTDHALVDVHREDIILRDGDEQLIFHADSTSKHPHKHGNKSINMINFIDITCEDCFLEVLKFNKSNHPLSGSTTPLSDFSPSLTPLESSDSLLEEFTDELALLDPFLPGKEDNNFDFEADLREIKFLLNQYPLTESNIETIDPILEKFTDEPSLDYLPPPGDDDDKHDDLFNLKSDNDEWKKLLYGDCYKDIYSEKDKNKDSKMKSLVVEAHFVESNNLLP
nr:reverse transcriptase domain-containing protein [Tanacetum cinerariifolium]